MSKPLGRAAVILPVRLSIPASVWDLYTQGLHQRMPLADGDDIELIHQDPFAFETVAPDWPFPGVRQSEDCADFGIYAAMRVAPHIDPVPLHYTIGVVLQGDHDLYVGGSHRVGRLLPGSVYVLHNKKRHWARPASGQSSLLGFVTWDRHADTLEDVVKEVSQALRVDAVKGADAALSMA